jgi:hypothetical protein
VISEPSSGARTWIPDATDGTIRHRYGMPWWAVREPHRWHSCPPQTVHLFCDGGVLSGSCYCACGAVTDHTGRWVGRNTRRNACDPAGLCRETVTPQPVRAWVAAGAAPHPGACRHLRSHRARPT